MLDGEPPREPVFYKSLPRGKEHTPPLFVLAPMPEADNAAAWKTFTSPDGTEAPCYIVRFGKDGECLSPKAMRAAIQASAGRSDVFLFSHGWNNDWNRATHAYESFIAGFGALRASRTASDPAYSPLLIGVFWPSTALVFGDEGGPQIAAGAPQPPPSDEVQAVADALPAAKRARFLELASKPSLSPEDVRELAVIGTGLYPLQPDTGTVSPTADELEEAWRQGQEEPDLGRVGSLRTRNPPAGPTMAGWPSGLDPRWIVRAFTVWVMKDRAGKVGAKGVSQLVRGILDTDARLHLVGHSYGAKVILSAVAAAKPNRRASSVLLLQPAINHLAFATNVPGTKHPGGYRIVLDYVEPPILATYSRNDQPLTRFFHLALRRRRDAGEAAIAAVGEPPSPYCALGGYGPRASGERLMAMPASGQPYPDLPNPIVGLDGSSHILSHGDVNTPHTWWALHALAFRRARHG